MNEHLCFRCGERPRAAAQRSYRQYPESMAQLPPGQRHVTHFFGGSQLCERCENEKVNAERREETRRSA